MNTIIRLFSVVSLLIVLTGCEEFPRLIDKVDGEFPLALSVEFVDPDIAPGDTALLRVKWGGVKLTPADLVWEVSWEYSVDSYGNESVYNRQSLAPFIVGSVVEVGSTEETQVFELSIAIPEDIILNSPGVPDDFSGLLSGINLGDNIEIDTFSIPTNKVDIGAFLDSLSVVDENKKSGLPKKYGHLLNGLCQVMTAQFRIYCDYTKAGGFNGEFNHSVRYHSNLEAIPGVYVNNPPKFTGGRLYEVADSGLGQFYPPDTSNADSLPLPYLNVYEIDNDSLTFKYNENHGYFLVKDISARDTTISLNQAFNIQDDDDTAVDTTKQMISYEQFTSKWYYDVNAHKSVGMVKQSDAEDQKTGNARMIYKLNFGKSEEIVKDTPLLCRGKVMDYRYGVNFYPEARDLQELWITIK